MPLDTMKVGPMKLHNKNKLAEQLMQIESMKVGPMKLHNNNNIAEQLMLINNIREEIQMAIV